MKLFKWIYLAVIVWGLSLVWPEVNLIISPALTIGLLVGLTMIGLAHLLDQHLNQMDEKPGYQIGDTLHCQITQPLPRPRHAQPTQPMATVSYSLSSNPTRPIRVGLSQNPSSRPTCPVAV
jgi:hypothetical protein